MTRAERREAAKEVAELTAAEFGVPFHVAWKAVRGGVVNRCEALAFEAADRAKAFTAAANALTRRAA